MVLLPVDTAPTILAVGYELVLEGATTLIFKVLRVACAGGRFLNCWELRYFHDASEMYTGPSKLHHRILRRENAWRLMQIGRAHV